VPCDKSKEKGRLFLGALDFPLESLASEENVVRGTDRGASQARMKWWWLATPTAARPARAAKTNLAEVLSLRHNTPPTRAKADPRDAGPVPHEGLVP
jgi:hypothetical protein